MRKFVRGPPLTINTCLVQFMTVVTDLESAEFLEGREESEREGGREGGREGHAMVSTLAIIFPS